MITQNKKHLVLAICLSGLAGFVDAVGFISLKGFFVSFMSGNSTRFAVAFAQNGFTLRSFTPLAIIVLFVIGVMAGAIIGHHAQEKRTIRVLSFIFFMLLICVFLHCVNLDALSIALLTVAMGAENNIFVKEGEVSVGVTYMTGTLVKFGQHFAHHLLGQKNKPWLAYLALWIGLITGAILGAFSCYAIGLNSLWIAAGFSGLLMLGGLSKTVKL